MMSLLHVIAIFLAIILMSAWMVVITIAIIRSEILNKLAELWKPLGIILLIVVLGFVARVWYLMAMDVQDFVNYVFGSCEPIDISKFGCV